MTFLKNEQLRKTDKAISKMVIALILLVVPFVSVAAWLWFGIVNVDTSEAAAGINKQITYQGRLVDSAGDNVTAGDYGFQFALYDSASSGTNLWEETWTSTTTPGAITIANGAFSVSLGTSTSLSTVDFNTDTLYLQVYFDSDGDGSFEETFTPRKRITASPYAFNSDTVDGLHASTTATAGQLLALDSGAGMTFNALTTLIVFM